MAEAVLTEEQKALLDRLRRRLGQTNDIDHKEEDLRLYRMLGAYQSDDAAEKEGNGKLREQQKDGDLHALLRELREYIIRNGTDGPLYMDAMDLLQSLAPEQMAETQNQMEKTEEQKAQEIEDAARLAQERAQDRIDQFGLYSADEDGNGIPDDVDEWLKEREEKQKEKEKAEEAAEDEKENAVSDVLKEGIRNIKESPDADARDAADAHGRRKMDPGEVHEMLKGESRPKHKRAETPEERKGPEVRKEDEALDRNIAIVPRK